MYKLYFELTKFDENNQVVHSDSYLINLDESGLFFKIILGLRNIFKRRSPNNIFEEFKL